MGHVSVQTSAGVVTVNQGIYITDKLDEKLRKYCTRSDGQRIKASEHPQAVILAQQFGRGTVVLGRDFPDMYLDEAISSAIRIRQYFPPMVYEKDGKPHILMDAMGPGYFPLRKDLLEGTKGPVIALLYGHQEKGEIDATKVDLSGLVGYFRNQNYQDATANTEFVEIHTQWVAGTTPALLTGKKDNKVYLISPKLDVSPYTIHVPKEKILELFEIGRMEADAFLARCRRPVWWIPFSNGRNGYR